MRNRMKWIFAMVFAISMIVTGSLWGALILPDAVAREGTEQLILSLTYPGEPGVMIFQHHKGDVRITGYDGEYIIINAAMRYVAGQDVKGENEDSDIRKGRAEDSDIRPVPGHALRLNGLEKNNVITLNSNSHERTIDLEIQLPYRFSVHIEKLDCGEIFVHNLSGEIEVSSESGDVNLSGITGSAVLNTVEGNIRARFAGVTSNVPMAFTSVTGNIDLFFPEDTRASLKMRTDHGEIMSGFDIDMEKRESGGGKSKETGIQRAFLDEWIHGMIGGGGPQFLLRSYSGNIFFRKNSNVSAKQR
ncbi:MAG: DUF4097 domain-containing protein [Bacteroidales bacterium]|nr:DUF4097 domain-containing protein [Candidatus Latescibacterota bacterium]